MSMFGYDYFITVMPEVLSGMGIPHATCLPAPSGMHTWLLSHSTLDIHPPPADKHVIVHCPSWQSHCHSLPKAAAPRSLHCPSPP